MKFLCVPCDEPMALREARGPFEETMSIVYGCPACGHSMAMLTNKMETQMVRSLGVKIGGRTHEAAPMEMLRSNLQGRREAVPSPTPASPVSKCPFTGVVTEAFASEALEWTTEATARIARIPDFVRPMVCRNVEDYARKHGHSKVDADVMDAMKGQLGV